MYANPASMAWGVTDPWGVVIAQFDHYRDGVLFARYKNLDLEREE